uniref:Protein Smaug homolog 1 n=1 Tax=Erpetoichthys calabaricus TaxID=27687 RepID=A0A8C4SNF3_ERPCA
MMFRDQVGVLASWFKGWNECEQTVTLLSLLKRVSRTQARFLQLCLEHSLADCAELLLLESEANNPALISQWKVEPKDRAIALILAHLPLLKPGNEDAKSEYMRLLPKILAHSIDHGCHLDESRQLLSYALIHPATSLEDRAALGLWLNHLEERAAARGADSLERTTTPHHQVYHPQRRGSDDRVNGWQSPRDSGIGSGGWHHQSCENGHLSVNPNASIPNTINSIGTCILSSGHSPLKRSVSLTPPMTGPNQSMGHGWLSQEDLRSRGPISDHAPLSPQSSIASSGSGGSEHLDDTQMLTTSSHRNTFHEDGSGMKDVPAWLKSLRLHKYASLFSMMNYEEMMSLTEEDLESQNVTKGARHKIIISIQKLKERENTLRLLEKDVMEGAGGLRTPLQELHQMILTPIKHSNNEEQTQHHLLSSERKGSDHGQHLDGAEGDSGGTIISEGDLPAQFTRVMGKVCTQLLVSKVDEENISSYLQLLDKCLLHEAFTETQKRRMLSWKQQVQKLFRSVPRKSIIDLASYRHPRSFYFLLFFSRAFGQSSSLPTVGCVGGGISARRNVRQFHVPSRSLPSARIGLLGTSSILGTSHRSTPTCLKQCRQGLWFANPGGSNSIPSRSHSSVQRTRSLPVHATPQAAFMFQQAEFQSPATEPDINNRLESLCLSVTEHALDGNSQYLKFLFINF